MLLIFWHWYHFLAFYHVEKDTNFLSRIRILESSAKMLNIDLHKKKLL